MIPFGIILSPMKVRSLAEAAAAVRGRRKELGLSQAELARRLGMSRRWVYQFEAGKPRAEFALVLRVLEELGLTMEIARDAAASDVSTPNASTSVDLDELLEEYRER